MHVVVVTTSYPESSSGSEAAGGFVESFARELAKHSRVTVVAATAGPSSVRTEGSLKVSRFSVKRWPLSLLRPHNPADWWPIVAALRDGQMALKRVVNDDKPDYVLALWALPSGYWAREMQRVHGIPYAVWALGSDIWSLGRIPVLRSYLRSVLKSADRCFADGLQLSDEVVRLSGKTCDFLPSARQLTQQDTRSPSDLAPYRLAFLGRWHANKGIDIFLDSLRALSNDDWDRISAVRVNGGGPLESDVLESVRELQALGHPVSVGGYLDTSQATDLIEWADYMVLPSRIESIPVIFSDAAQLGRPLVATPVGDLPGLFERRSFGVLSADATADEFTIALQRALRMPASGFESNLAEFAKEFDIEDVARKFAAYVEEVRQ